MKDIALYFIYKFSSLCSHLMNFAKLRQAKILKKIIKIIWILHINNFKDQKSAKRDFEVILI